MMRHQSRSSRLPETGGAKTKIQNLPFPLLPNGGAAVRLLPFREAGEGLFLAVCFFFLAASAACAAPRATVTVYPTATVAATDVTLGDIAAIKCDDKTLLTRLASAVMGRAPMPGVTRPLTGGDVRLKLRQDGIDPEDITFAGSDTITVSAVASASTDAGASAPSPAARSTDVLIHRSDSVNLVYECDGVVITARVTAIAAGAAGDQISVHRDGADRPLRGTVVDSQTVRLEE